MRPKVSDGWLRVSYDGPELVAVYMATGARPPKGEDEWKPAFLDWHEGQRVAQIRVHGARPGQVVQVWLKVDGNITNVGSVRL